MNLNEIEYTFHIAQFGSAWYDNHPAFMQYDGKKWYSVSFSEFNTLSDYLACAFIELGIEPGTRIATIFSANSYEWHIVDTGTAKAGLVHVPIYPTISDSDYRYILQQVEPHCIIVNDQSTYNKIIQLIPEMPWVRGVYSVQQLVNVQNYTELISLGREVFTRQKGLLEQRIASCTPNTLATIIYTSGTTGFPKGVMLSHKNLVSNAITAAHSQPLEKGHRVLSFLPLCHIYDRTANYQFLMKWVTVAFVSSMKNLFADFKTLQPDGTTVVPRVLEKVIQKVYAQAVKMNCLLRKLVLWSLQIGLRYNPDESLPMLYRLKLQMANWVLFRHIRETFGGRCRYIGSGGAHLMPQIERFFWAAKMPVYQGYGLTECAPLIALNNPAQVKTGTVGTVIENVEVRFTEKKEILVRGPNVMKGYYKLDKETDEAFEDGWLHTGDMGVIEDGFLKIIGRTKQMFKTSYGKYIVPQAIENKYTTLPEISHAVVLGEGRHCAGAIVVPNFLFFREQMNASADSFSNEQLIALPEIKKQLEGAVKQVNRQLGKTEQIKKCLFVPDEWSVETGEISSTYKIRRNLISHKYQVQIRKMFSENIGNQLVCEYDTWEVPPDSNE